MKIIDTLLHDTYDTLKKKARQTYEKSIKFETEINNYLNKKYKQNSKLKTFLHRAEPINLEKIYQPVCLEPNITTTSIKSLFKKNKNITIIGTAGSGKTTLVKYLFNKSIKEKFAIPIIIELRYLNEFEGSVEQYIFQELMQISIEISQDTFLEFLSHGKFVFFLDGYDELGSKHLQSTVKNLVEFTKKFDNNYYLLTSRPGTRIQDSLYSFATYRIRTMTTDEIFSFVEKQHLEKEFINKIKQSITDNIDALSEYIRNPLLLSLYILTYQKNPAIPNNKSTYYRRVFDILFQEHDSLSKLSFEREKRTNLTQHDFDKVLQSYSLITYFSNSFYFSKQQVCNILSKIEYSADFKYEDFIHDLLIGLSLWIEDDGRYSFIHRSMQEYFAAEYISHTKDYKELIYQQLRSINEQLNHSESYNLLDMCRDIDEYYFKKYYHLPLLQEIEYKINHPDSDNNLKSLKKLSVIYIFYNYIYPEGTNYKYEKYHYSLLSLKTIVDTFLSDLMSTNKISKIKKQKYQFSGFGHAIDITMLDEEAYQYLLNNGLSDIYDTFIFQLKAEIEQCRTFLEKSTEQENTLISTIFKKH